RERGVEELDDLRALCLTARAEHGRDDLLAVARSVAQAQDRSCRFVQLHVAFGAHQNETRAIGLLVAQVHPGCQPHEYARSAALRAPHVTTRRICVDMTRQRAPLSAASEDSK